jgi:hypothetical protein
MLRNLRKLKPDWSAKDDIASVEVALKRDEWTQLLKKARAHRGLSSQ